MAVERFGCGARLSEAVVANGFVFLSGMVPETGGDITAQTADVLRQIDAWLAQCDSDKSRIVEATIFLANMADYAGMNAAWDAWVEAKLANGEWLVEIKVSAVANTPKAA